MQTNDLDEIARRHGVSAAAAEAVLAALRASGGRSAQFSHPDLGGSGQWMPGMVQVGDMFNTALRAKVDGLCAELAGVARVMPAARPGSERSEAQAPDVWWPAAFGTPDAAGGQNDARYAWFARSKRLAVQREGRVTLHDTGEHRISGVSQQQGTGAGRNTLSFSTDRGTLDLDSLPVVRD